MTHPRRIALFVMVATGSVALAAAYLGVAVRRTAAASTPAETSTSAVPAASLPAPGTSFFLFRSTARGPHYGALAYTGIDRRDAPQPIPLLQCRRVHMASGRGVCLAARGGTAFRARLFDDTFAVIGELSLAGVPSRVQVAPDGRLAATTVFVSGHSYADAAFSTQTSIIDLKTGTWLVESLETFTIRRKGAVLRSIDFNFWGVTFMRDGRSFYETLGTRGQTLLVRGNVDDRSVEVVEDDVECPSLSPDNRRIAYKQRTNRTAGPVTWGIWVLDVETRMRHRLPETNSVDDQLQWLDDSQLLYARPSENDPASTDQWTVAADASGPPTRYLARAYSGTLVTP